MATDGSVTYWLGQLQAGDPAAAQQLWELYFRRLVGLARQKLRGLPRRAADEEDVALSAFESFCRGAECGQFPRLDDRDNLWQLLVVITARKAAHLIRHECQRKRGGGAVLDEAALADSDADRVTGLGEILSREPSPAFAAQVAEECQRLLQRLEDSELVSVAVWKMEGFSNDEIAARLRCVPRSVERKLRLIREIWGEESSDEPSAA
jgi:DNA-directed RNA polymerase specialized sigma24 family protein